MKLGYLVFAARSLERWRRFGVDMLGLPPPVENADGSIGFAIDEQVQRLVIVPRRSDDLLAIGLEVDRLPDGARADASLRAARRVEDLVVVRDPAGNAIELFVGPSRGSPAPPGAFVTGDLGMGHVGILARDFDAMERFYVDVLGFGVSERFASKIGPIPTRGVFLHCNRRHHSLALLDLPLEKRVHHFMLQAADVSMVGRAYDRARRLGVPIDRSLGQHADSDGTVSFYGVTPSGFDFEIGAGCRELGPNAGPPALGGDWGHHPSPRLKLKMLLKMLRAILQRPLQTAGIFAP